MDPEAVAAALLAHPGRGPCSWAERRAAHAVAERLDAAGHAPELPPRWLRPRGPAAVGLAALLGGAASLASLWAPAAGVAGALAAALCLALEAAGLASPARLAFPRRATQDVLVAPRATSAGIVLWLCAPYDAPRGGLLAAARIRALAVRLRRRGLPSARAWLALAALAVAATAAARAGGAGGPLLGAAQLIPTAALLLAAGAALDAALAGRGAGRETAEAAAVAVAAFDELAREPPPGVTPALLLHGAGSGGPQALRARLREVAQDPRRAAVVAVVPAEPRPPRAAATRTRHAGLRRAASRAAAALELRPAAAPSPPWLRPPAVTLAPASGAAERAVELAVSLADATSDLVAPAPARVPAP